MNLLLINSPVPSYAINGRTLVNLLGKDGNFESLPSGWSDYHSSTTLDITNHQYGSNGIKVAISAGYTSGQYYKNITVDNSKYYLAMADVKNGNATSCYLRNASTVITDTTKFNTSYKKYSGVSSIEFGLNSAGTEGQYAYFDGARLYEIDLATYNKIDIDPEYTGERLAQKFPYVDSVQFKQNTLVSAKGKNLIDLYAELYAISPSDVSVVTEDGLSCVKVTNSANFTNKVLSCKFKPLTQYTFSYKMKYVTAGGLTFKLYYTDGTSQVFSLGGSTFTNYSYTSTAGKSIDYIKNTYSDNTTVFINACQLELGSVATPFEPQVKTQAHCSLPLATDDRVYITGQGAVYKKAWEKGVSLTGVITWSHYANLTGYKRITAELTNFTGLATSSTNLIVSKYDGKILTPTSSWDAGDECSVGSKFNLSINNTDSGWIDSLTPSVSEISAYFYGWKMCDSAGNAYVSGTKYWKKLTDGTGITSTIPTASYAGYTPYTLSYKLATPVEYVNEYNGMPILSYGSNLQLNPAVKQLEQKTGYNWELGTDDTNQYASTIPTLAVENPDIKKSTGYLADYFDMSVGESRKFSRKLREAYQYNDVVDPNGLVALYDPYRDVQGRNILPVGAENFGTWTKSAVTTVSSGQPDPDGGNNAYKVTTTASVASYFLYRAISVVPVGTNIARGVWCKKGAVGAKVTNTAGTTLFIIDNAEWQFKSDVSAYLSGDDIEFRKLNSTDEVEIYLYLPQQHLNALSTYSPPQGLPTQLTDYSGNGNHLQLGSATGSDANDPSFNGTAIITGADDYLKSASASFDDMAEMTVQTIATYNSAASKPRIFDKSNGTSYIGPSFIVEDDLKPTFYRYGSAGNYRYWKHANALTNGLTYHIALASYRRIDSVDDSKLTIGTTTSTTTATGGTPALSSDANYDLYVNNRYGADRPWLAEMQMMAIYNKVKTEQEKQRNYNAMKRLMAARGVTVV